MTGQGRPFDEVGVIDDVAEGFGIVGFTDFFINQNSTFPNRPIFCSPPVGPVHVGPVYGGLDSVCV